MREYTSGRSANQRILRICIYGCVNSGNGHPLYQKRDASETSVQSNIAGNGYNIADNKDDPELDAPRGTHRAGRIFESKKGSQNLITIPNKKTIRRGGWFPVFLRIWMCLLFNELLGFGEICSPDMQVIDSSR